MRLIEFINVVDNSKGLGQVPYNQEVDYFGLKVYMTPDMFLKLAAPLREPSKNLQYIYQHISNGGKIGAPFLNLELPPDWTEGDFTDIARVVGHEGRHRMLSIKQIYGNKPLEVHLFPRGYKNRHLTDEIIKQLNRHMIAEKSDNVVKGPIFSLK